MRLYTHTHTGVLKNKEKERQEEVESINAADNLWQENAARKISGTNTSTDYVNTINRENCVNKVEKTNNKTEKKEQKNKKRIKSEEGKLQKVSCLLVMRKISIIVILMIIVIAILVCFGIKYNWKIANIVEEIGKVINISGTSAEIEEVAAMDMTKIDLVPDKNNVNVPMPKGYVLSGASDENDVTKGAVIYEGTTAVTDANVATEKTTRNQWVWVPVSAANVSRIYSEDAYGRKSGKLYEYSSSGRKASTEGGFEPGVSTFTDIENELYLQQYNLYGYTRNKLYEEMQRNYEETIESIKTYGGFYIGRYETGNLSQRKPVCVQYNNDIADQTWYTMYNKAQYLGGSAGVKSMMIYGSLWDEVMMWLYESGAKSYAEIGDNSTDWGNYSNAIFSYYATSTSTSTSSKKSSTYQRLRTGAKAGASWDNWKRNCANNIYDLAGNVDELTQECDSGKLGKRGYRGGAYNVGGINEAGWRSHWSSTKSVDSIGCRVYFIIS